VDFYVGGAKVLLTNRLYLHWNIYTTDKENLLLVHLDCNTMEAIMV